MKKVKQIRELHALGFTTGGYAAAGGLIVLTDWMKLPVGASSLAVITISVLATVAFMALITLGDMPPNLPAITSRIGRAIKSLR